MKSLAILLVFAIAGCAGTPSQDSAARQATEFTCAGATAALKTAIQFNAKLSPAQRAQVTTATKVLDPVCSQPTMPSLSSTESIALKNALGTLTGIATVVNP